MPPTMMKRWFGGDAKKDAEIMLLFKQDLLDVGHGKVGHWQFDKDGKLATLLLCDQMSRNIYRGMAGAFSFDHISQRLAKHIIAKFELFEQYALFEKLFIVMPLMNSENEEDAQLCADVLTAMIDQLRTDK
jgi:uncharacterized protein (DUF924 family)